MDIGKTKILAIDDNSDNLISIKALIKDIFPDYVTLVANNGKKGIELAELEDPDVILLDVIMPEMDGFTTCQQLKAQQNTRDIPVVFLTALRGDQENRIRALEVGADAFLSKPIDLTDLTIQIRAMQKIKAANSQKRREKDFLAKLVAEKTVELERSHAATLNLLEDLRKENEARKQKEIALGESENRFRLLFEQLTVGFALHEIILNEQGVPVDYRFLEINPVFEALTGLNRNKVIGKTVLEVMPTTEKYWIDTYGRVAVSGVPQQIENYSGELQRHYSVNAYSPKLGQFAVLVKDITDQKQAEEVLKQNIRLSEIHIKRLNNLRRIDLAITQCDDYEIMLNEILAAVCDSLGVEVADILLTDSGQDIFHLAAIKGVENGDVFCSEFPATDSCLSMVLKDFETILSHEHGCEHVTQRFRQKFNFHGMTPLIAKGELKGILEIYHPDAPELEDGWKDFFYALGLQTAIAIDNIDLQARRQQANFELIKAYDETIAGWSHALDLRDHETEGHSQRVTEMTQLLAQELGISEKELVHIRRGALLHDIGKVGIPDSILLKPAALSDQEWEIMRCHPVYARDLMMPIVFLQPAMDIPYCHHEKWDGSGYPRGLKGEEIPLAARIFAVVDVWDALQSDRPYRKGWQNEAIFEYIQKQAGLHFDPQVVDVFISHYESITRPFSNQLTKEI